MRLAQAIRERAGVRAVLSNIGWLSGDRIVRMLAGLLVTTAIARYLGPSEFGLLNYGVAIYGLFNIVSNLGLDFLVVRELALDESDEGEILGTAFVLKVLASIVMTIVAVVATRLLEPGNRMLVMIVTLLSIAAISQAFEVIEFSFQARTESRYSVVPRNVNMVVVSIARLAAIWMKLSLTWFVWIAAAELAMAEAGLVISYLKVRRPLIRWTWKLERAKLLLKESWALTISSLMLMVYMRSDQVLLGKLSSTSAVGEYSAAIRLSEIWYAIPVIICTSAMPRLLKAKAGNPEQYYGRLQRLYESMVLVSVVVAVGTQLAGPFVVRLLYGANYAGASSILAVHIWTGVFVFAGTISGQQLIQEGLSVSLMQRALLGAVLNVLLNFWWIPRWGGVGSAMATLVAQSFASYLADAFDSRTRHIFKMKTRAYLLFWKLPLQLAGKAA